MAIVYLYGRYTSKYYSYIANKCRIVSYYLHRQDKEYTIRDRDLVPDIRFSGTQN